MIVSGTDGQTALFADAVIGPKRPLLKWAGGKSQLMAVLHRAMPREFSRYAELFFGGGALFWSLGLPGSLVADSNPELMNFYEVVRDAPKELLAAVRGLPITKDDYYRIRRLRPGKLTGLDRAARFVYLNKTCYNGLYRVNRDGQFNTPFGGRTDVAVLDEQDVQAASSLLRVPIRMPREPRCDQNGFNARKGDEAAPERRCGEEP